VGGHCELSGYTVLCTVADKKPVQGGPVFKKGEEMKYVVSWTTRLTGSAAENEAATRRGLALFSKWQPPASTTFHQFVGRLDGRGGFSVVETDNPADLLDASSKFGPTVDYEIFPVVDIAEWIQGLQQGAEFRESIS
jgi:hypothetical protein